MTAKTTLIRSDPEVLGGIPVFSGTRVPVQTFLDYIAEGHTVDEFVDDFPAVSREQAGAVLDFLKQVLLEQPYARAA